MNLVYSTGSATIITIPRGYIIDEADTRTHIAKIQTRRAPKALRRVNTTKIRAEIERRNARQYVAQIRGVA